MFSNGRTRYFYVFCDKKHAASADLKFLFLSTRWSVFRSISIKVKNSFELHELLNSSETATVIKFEGNFQIFWSFDQQKWHVIAFWKAQSCRARFSFVGSQVTGSGSDQIILWSLGSSVIVYEKHCAATIGR